MNSLPEPQTPRRPWIDRLSWAVPLACGALVGIAMRLLYSGKPGYPYHAMVRSFFLLVPLVVGAVAVYVAERARHRGWRNDFWIGASANALFVLGCLLITIEGLICAVLAVPLFFLLGGLAGLAMGAVCRWTRWPRQAMYGFAALPLLFGGVEQYLPVPRAVDSIERSCVVSASREAIWRQLTVAENIRPSEIGSAWMYRIGSPPSHIGRDPVH